MNKETIIKGLTMTGLTILVFALNLIPYIIGWFCYQFLNSLFSQLPDFTLVQFVLGALAIRFIWSLLFGKNKD